MHKIRQIRSDVNRTHNGLGNLVAVNLLSSLASKCLLVVGTQGTGKSVALEAVYALAPERNIRLDAVTRSGLESRQEKLTGFRGLFVVDDLGAIDTDYSASESIKVLALLTHEHRLSKSNATIDMAISDFHGSTAATIQPAAIGKIISKGSWEAVLQDKVTRYYHLTRPKTANHAPIRFKCRPRYKQDSVSVPGTVDKAIRQHVDTHVMQWSDSRAIQHLLDYTKAAARADGRNRATALDLKVVLEVLAPCNLEDYLIYKKELATERQFLVSDCCILTELASYGHIEPTRTRKNYRISASTYYRIMGRESPWYIDDPRHKGIKLPGQAAIDALTEGGYMS